jgi:hypothetical protein
MPLLLARKSRGGLDGVTLEFAEAGQTSGDQRALIIGRAEKTLNPSYSTDGKSPSLRV